VSAGEHAPLRAVLSRTFVAYEGTHITLACRHVIVRSRSKYTSKMRCQQCADDAAKAVQS
jgi:hypothetical protein